MLSVYTRHAADCAKAKDKEWRRCRCPKWISGTHDGELVRKSAKTRSWEKTEEYRRHLEGASSPTPVQTYESVRISDRAATGHHRDQKKARVTVETAEETYLSAARSRGLESSTLSKLEGIFRKQFLAWCSSQGYKLLDEVDLDALLTFRDTWIEGPLAKRKKQEQEHLIGFFCKGSALITLAANEPQPGSPRGLNLAAVCPILPLTTTLRFLSAFSVPVCVNSLFCG
jgi:integrase/recombinase XerD